MCCARVQAPNTDVIDGSWLVTRNEACHTRRATQPLLDLRYEGAVVYTHADCACNEELALRNRHQKACHQVMTSLNAARLDKEVQSLVELIPEEVRTFRRFSAAEVLAHYSGAKLQKYTRAWERSQGRGYQDGDSRVRMFLKADKYVVRPLEDAPTKAPRCIQYRSPEYCIRLARYLFPIEEALYQAEDELGCRIFAKGRNSHQRAADLVDKAEKFLHPVFFCLDHSAWDAHVSVRHLQAEHSLYKKIFPDPLLARLLKAQLRNRGSTAKGTRFYTPGTRMSGDMNTGLGNSLLNAAILRLWLKDSGVRGSVYVDGDDSVVVVDAADCSRLKPVKEWMATMGMETKLEIAWDLESCEFCQCRPVWDGVGWRMVRNPVRVLERIGWSVQPNSSAKFCARLIRTIGECELALSMGVPVLQVLAEVVRDAGSGALWSGYEGWYQARLERYKPGRAVPKEITQEARLSFEAAWGWSVSEQLAAEQSLRAMASTVLQSGDWAQWSSLQGW